MTSPSSVSGPTSGPIIGGYRLLARIGEGGMGVVHLVEGRDGRRVAMKVLRPHVVGDDEARQRLAREVASLRQVRSPHVAEVLDADPWGEVPYVVTRFVPGHSLHETVLRDGPLADPDLGHVGRRLLEAVRDVHASDVLHRDLKPTNVVMEGRSPILIDFGLARLAEDPRLTAAGWLLGTPGYLAPEMLFGDPATAATDVHGWAATLVYAATGRSPYGAGHTMAILDRTRLGEVDLGGVPDRLRPLLAECLALEPLDRPSVHELRLALATLEEPPPSGAAEPMAGRAGASPVVPGQAAPPTMPWPLVAEEPAATDAIRQPPSGVAPAADPPTVVQPAVDPALEPPTRPYTAVVRPAPPPTPTRVQPGPVGGPPPPYIAPTPGLGPPAAGGPAAGNSPGAGAGRPGAPVPPDQQQHARPLPSYPRPADRPLSGWARFRRGSAVALLGAAVTVLFAVAPYLTALAVAAAVVLLRGAAFGHEASWRRRTARGPKWSDGPRAVVGYPWHVLRGSVGSAFLLLTAGVLASAAVGSAKVIGLADRDALLAGGAVAVATVWWGPGGQRVRLPVGRTLTAAVRNPLAGCAVLAVLAAFLVGGWVAAQSGVTWAPGVEPPWSSLPDLVPADLRGGL